MSRSDQTVAVPLHGKMAFRSFHTDAFINQLKAQGCVPLYYVEKSYVDGGLDSKCYSVLQQAPYERIYEKPVPRLLCELRRFLVNTETTDLRFRDTVLNFIFSKRPITQILLYSLWLDGVRRLRLCARALLALEHRLTRIQIHQPDLRQRSVCCVLTPGVGSYGFLYEGCLAREAQELGIPVVASVSNYDNIVNRGYLGFVPKKLAVWSPKMAREAHRFLRLDEQQIAVTGAVQFDRYAKAPALSREAFLRSKGLDPAKKTIFYAGGVLVPQYFEFLRVVRDYLMTNGKLKNYNVVIRPVPHNKVLSWYGMDVLKDIVSNTEGMYYSDPRQFSTDSFMPVGKERCDSELDELHCLFRYSDVMINIYSTVALEAAINDLPTIHLGYESFSYGQRYPSYPGFQAGMTHNLSRLRLAAGKVVRSDEELLRYLEIYLNNRDVDCQSRHDYALEECGDIDGNAGTRLAALIKETMRAQSIVQRDA